MSERKTVTVDIGNGPVTMHGLNFWMRTYERVRALRINAQRKMKRGQR